MSKVNFADLLKAAKTHWKSSAEIAPVMKALQESGHVEAAELIVALLKEQQEILTVTAQMLTELESPSAKKSVGTGIIPVTEAEALSRAYDCPMVILYVIEPCMTRFSVTTYGKTKKLCRHAADLGRKFAKVVLNGEVAPSTVEPTHLPDVPETLVSKT